MSEIRDGSVTEYLFLKQQPIAVVTGGFIGLVGDRGIDNDRCGSFFCIEKIVLIAGI
ncbi:hypothetical protein [Candidatus Thiodiazotropha sp. LNASS1]|uniref:hypothetical protein n=1 Tax=Candidatus Thiodiazotropha sp. LNASS1 TaxID=3096260 RepID=UPI0034727D9D